MGSSSQAIFALIENDKLTDLTALLDEDPMLVNIRHADPALNHWTALQFAAAFGKLDACRLLVERGAEVYTNPMNTYPPVIQAAWKKHQAVVDYFLNEIPDKANGTNGFGVMINLAAREGWADIVAKHIAADPLVVFQRGWIGDSPLHWPSHNNYVEIVEMLLDAGADIEADEIFWIGGKPLIWASEHAPGTVDLLLRRGANVNGRNVKRGSQFEGVTPLIMNATQKDDCAEVTELLIAAGADLNAVDATGKTALDHATVRSLPRITETLTRHGAQLAG
ncbi:MAG TPA: ankyrin repeat domain-containing protein [Capsulimonadaceae bacterium]|jgi:ankyrin repeat protein